MIIQIQEAHGFCPRHTLYLLTKAEASAVAGVYRFAIPAWVTRARRLERDLDRRRGSSGIALADLARPSSPCPACVQERSALDRVLQLLSRTLTDPEVHERAARSQAICVAHLLAAARASGWTELRALVEVALHGLSDGNVECLWGIDSDAEARRWASAREAPEAELEPSSTSLSDLHRLLGRAACPICSVARIAVGRYLRWLEHELLAPTHHWLEVTSLCPTHVHELTSRADPASTAALAARARSEWTARLRILRADLEQQPPDSRLSRLLKVLKRLRGNGWADQDGSSGVQRWTPPSGGCAASVTALSASRPAQPATMP
jgi:hypothetical protein